jgi:hypothetical protein
LKLSADLLKLSADLLKLSADLLKLSADLFLPLGMCCVRHWSLGVQTPIGKREEGVCVPEFP